MKKNQQALVMDGNEIKLRLQADRRVSGTAVHVDWLRFTVQRKHAPVPTVDALFPAPVQRDSYDYSMSENDMDIVRWKRAKVSKLLRELPDSDFAASAQAHVLAQKICSILGSHFEVEPELKKGQDFYRFRWSIVRHGAEAGWVGFLASGESPRQQAQSQTIHANLYGAACTFANGDWRHRIANLIEDCDGKVTRIDLALDFFDGIDGGVERIRDEWQSGSMDIRGHRPDCNTVGPWVEGGRGRSFYFGSKEAGKQTNVYEKGVQLFGKKDATNWERIELRYGNKLRDLPAEMLRNPDGFFSGASDWHASMLTEHGKTVFPEPVKVKAKQAVQNVKAEVTRAVRWLNDTASQSLALAFQFLGNDEFIELVSNRAKPGRLRKFGDTELKAAFAALSPKLYQPRARLVA